MVTASAAAVALARALFTAPLEAPPPAATLPIAVVEVRPPRPVSVPLAEPLAPAPAAPGRPRRSAPAPAAAAPVLPAPNPLLEESRLLGEAVQQLRLEGRPEAALEVLGRYRLRFPDGALKGEADAVQLEALLKQGQSGPALELLARLAERDFAQVPRADELRVVHGELLARAGRHREAVAAFTRALEHLGANERSLFGRAASRLELNEREAARNDLAECVRLFPNGRFATDARNQLAAP
ncbi:MAG: hypothetical protein IPJ65_30780 [Archangiaceae bacterium]|nr:hypothetical protein [Archangiaceae bacterium]